VQQAEHEEQAQTPRQHAPARPVAALAADQEQRDPEQHREHGHEFLVEEGIHQPERQRRQALVGKAPGQRVERGRHGSGEAVGIDGEDAEDGDAADEVEGLNAGGAGIGKADGRRRGVKGGMHRQALGECDTETMRDPCQSGKAGCASRGAEAGGRPVRVPGPDVRRPDTDGAGKRFMPHWRLRLLHEQETRWIRISSPSPSTRPTGC
jgi:hypothetical protein